MSNKLTECPVCRHPILYAHESKHWECTFCKTTGTDSTYQGTFPEFTANMKALVEEASGIASHVPSSIKTAMGMAAAMTEAQIAKFKSTYERDGKVTFDWADLRPKGESLYPADEPPIGPKYDTGKLQYGLIPPIATRSLAQVLTFGAAKYAPNSWQRVPDGERRYTDALYRHLEQYRMGESTDAESGLSHLAHAITNIAFLLHFEAQRHNKES